MTEVNLNTSKISDWDSFHTSCAEAFGFPDFYGRNKDAFIDCLSYLDDGMSKFVLQADENLLINVLDFQGFSARAPQVAQAFAECVAFINTERAPTSRLLLSLQ